LSIIQISSFTNDDDDEDDDDIYIHTYIHTYIPKQVSPIMDAMLSLGPIQGTYGGLDSILRSDYAGRSNLRLEDNGMSLRVSDDGGYSSNIRYFSMNMVCVCEVVASKYRTVPTLISICCK